MVPVKTEMLYLLDTHYVHPCSHTYYTLQCAPASCYCVYLCVNLHDIHYFIQLCVCLYDMHYFAYLYESLSIWYKYLSVYLWYRLHVALCVYTCYYIHTSVCATNLPLHFSHCIVLKCLYIVLKHGTHWVGLSGFEPVCKLLPFCAWIC